MVLETTVIKICVPTVGNQAISTMANLWLVLQSSILLCCLLFGHFTRQIPADCKENVRGGIPIQEWSIISYHFQLQKQEYECSVSNGQDGLQELT